jgi:hypothetical protein
MTLHLLLDIILEAIPVTGEPQISSSGYHVNGFMRRSRRHVQAAFKCVGGG